MKDSNGNFEAMKKGLLELTELKHILRKTQVFFEEVIFVHNKSSVTPYSPNAYLREVLLT